MEYTHQGSGMELLADLGDPCAFLEAKDHIVFKLGKPWPPNKQVPNGCFLRLEAEHRRLLSTSPEGLVANVEILQSLKITDVLFAGCKPFVSCESYQTAAMDVFRDTTNVYLIHNRDSVLELIRLFPQATLMVLEHNLAFDDWALLVPLLKNRPQPPTEPSLLKTLMGSSLLTMTEGLYFAFIIVERLFKYCHQLRSVQAPLHHPFIFNLAPGNEFTATTTESLKSDQLIFGFQEELSGRKLHYYTPEPKDIMAAASLFQNVRHLQVTIKNIKTFDAIRAFAGLDSLSVTFVQYLGHQMPDLRESLPMLLENYNLQRLSLSGCSGVCLSDIAQHCQQLKNLRLRSCRVEDEKQETGSMEKSFPSLESLEVDSYVGQSAFSTLVRASNLTLGTMCAHDAVTCSDFLKLACMGLRFPKLEKLDLVTCDSLDELDIDLSDVEVSASFPLLQHLKSNSRDLKSFFSQCGNDRIHVSNSDCATCKARRLEMMEAGEEEARRFPKHRGNPLPFEFDELCE